MWRSGRETSEGFLVSTSCFGGQFLVDASQGTMNSNIGDRHKPIASHGSFMYVLGLATGVGVPEESVVDEVADALAGRVAVLSRDSGAGGDRTRYELGSSGATIRRPDADLTRALDDLARDHDHAILVGYPESGFPHVVVGDADADDVLLSAPTPDTIDFDAVREGLRERDEYESLDSLVADVKRSPRAEYAGAIATFSGIVREKEGQGDDPTTSLTFEKYEGVAEQRLAGIREELEAREGVHDVRFHHRTGRIEAGADIVFVVVLAGHRDEAFRTVEDGINRLKDEVPIFKKELTVEDEFWVHDRDE